MDDNTKVMLKLATLLAQQNNARVNNTPGQNPLTELATQLLMNSANETLAIPTSMQCNSAKQQQQQQDNHNSNTYATQVMTNSQNIDTSNHIADAYNTSHNQRVEVNIKPITNKTTEDISINTSVAKDIITLTPPVNRDSYGIVSSAIGNRESFSPVNRENFSVHSPVLKDSFNGSVTNSLLNTSNMNRDMFTVASSGCRDSYTTTSTVNRGNVFPVTSSANRDTYTTSTVGNNATQQSLMPTVNRDSFSTSLNRDGYCNSVLNRDNFNLSRDTNNSVCPDTRDSFSTNCSVTRDSFTDNSPIIRDSFPITSPINRETYTGTSMTYPTTSVNRGSFSSLGTEEQESFTMNSPNRVQEGTSINTVNMMRNDITNNSSLNRVQDEMAINRVDDVVVSSISNMNTPMCSMSSMTPSSEMPVNSNNCAYYKRPIQGEKGRSYPQPVILRSRPRPAKERSKRGPKEKDYFRTAFFCLPSVTARLPRFTSADPREQELVYEYQKKGYGKMLLFLRIF